MGWIDLKFKDLDDKAQVQQASASNATKDQNARAAICCKAWEQLASVLRADIYQYNSHPKAQKRIEIRVMPRPKLIEVYGHGETRVLLQISLETDGVIFSFSALSLGPDRSRQYSGEIAPVSENEFAFIVGREQALRVDAAKLSEELLSPVLFP
jgi:hypothetical protein